LRAEVLLIRAQSAIRADGAPSAQVRALQFEVSAGVQPVSADVQQRPLRAARANRDFCTDKKHPCRNRGYDEKQGQCGFYTRSTIRADSCSPAQQREAAARGWSQTGGVEP
jgi:hypothetical protein